MPQLQRGVLIALEGIDGSGKSTLAQNLTTFFHTQTFPVVLTKEPGGTLLGKQLRSVLQEKKVPVSPKAEYLLFAADRAQHMEELIQPSLEKKMIVISDRMGDSAIAYQGYGRKLDIPMIKTSNLWAMNSIKPDLTIYVHIDLATSLQRIAARNETPTSFEQEKKDFFQRVIMGFDEMYKNRDDVIIVDGQLSKEEVTSQTLEKVLSWLKSNQFLR
jgi:dTMP kinase